MTTETDIINRALQVIGSRTTVTLAELQGNLSNEAIQANLVFTKIRDDLLRMAPWNCALNTENLNIITSAPGTPENTGDFPSGWVRGLPSPPWLYEYQYPVDCLRACWIVPSDIAGAVGVPIFPTAAISAPYSNWVGPPVRFRVQVDQFFPVIASSVASGGSGHAVGDIITLLRSTNPPMGAPAKLRVLTVVGGVITVVSPVNQIMGSAGTQSGSYFTRVLNPQIQGSTTGVGVGSSFNVTFGTEGSQRVILTDQPSATLVDVKQVIDPNVMDALFQEAWAHILGAKLAIALTGDKTLANNAIEVANSKIEQARSIDGNEGLTINDILPDWLRIRGITFPQTTTGGFNWGSLLPPIP